MSGTIGRWYWCVILGGDAIMYVSPQGDPTIVWLR